MKIIHILKKTLFVALLILGSASGSSYAQHSSSANPFLTVVGKPYSDYHDTYMRTVSELLHKDSLSRVKLLHLLDEAAKADASGEWDILRRGVGYSVDFYESRDGGFVYSPDYTGEDYSKDLVKLASDARKKGFNYLNIWFLFQAAEGYRTFAQDYERAFTCYLEAVAGLDTISTKNFPPKPNIYNHLAALYYTFREYDDAVIYYRKIIEDPDSKEHYYKSYFGAMNGLGLCYRYGYKDYAESDYYFKQILEQTVTSEGDWEVWESIAKGNIGYNYYLKGELDTALIWLIPAIEKFSRPNDLVFISNRAVNVADIYLRKNKPELAKKYITIALDYHEKTKLPEMNSGTYEVLSRYYTLIGDKQQANMYLDSTLEATKRENNAFSGLVLRHVEQKLRNIDNKIHEQELIAEQTRSRTYMYVVVGVSVALVIILFLLGLILFFYNRKRNAYRELVRQNQRWAEIVRQEEISADEAEQADDINTDDKDIVTETEKAFEESDQVIMDSIEKAISEDKLYKQMDLTLDSLASQIGFSRYYISGTLNRCTGKNFNTYVNEYRIKEAIRLISDPSTTNMTIEGIAFESGFNDRKSFHRVFKKITGLSPGDFRKNMTGR